MNGEIDLELYTISMIRLNIIFQKIDADKKINEIITDIEDCVNDLIQLHEYIVQDLSQEEININEYDPFFENGMLVFPEYYKNIENYIKEEENNDLKASLANLACVFIKLIETGNQYFKKRGLIK